MLVKNATVLASAPGAIPRVPHLARRCCVVWVPGGIFCADGASHATPFACAHGGLRGKREKEKYVVRPAPRQPTHMRYTPHSVVQMRAMMFPVYVYIYMYIYVKLDGLDTKRSFCSCDWRLDPVHAAASRRCTGRSVECAMKYDAAKADETKERGG